MSNCRQSSTKILFTIQMVFVNITSPKITCLRKINIYRCKIGSARVGNNFLCSKKVLDSSSLLQKALNLKIVGSSWEKQNNLPATTDRQRFSKLFSYIGSKDSNHHNPKTRNHTLHNMIQSMSNNSISMFDTLNSLSSAKIPNDSIAYIKMYVFFHLLIHVQKTKFESPYPYRNMKLSSRKHTLTKSRVCTSKTPFLHFRSCQVDNPCIFLYISKGVNYLSHILFNSTMLLL